MIYILLLGAFHYFGLFDQLFKYRETFAHINAGSTLGVNLFNVETIKFLFLAIYSVLSQLFGLYIISMGALFLFITESIPFIFGVIYIVRNRIYLTDFERFLLLFSLVYATIWCLANDNLGTAVRIRMFNYIAILIVAGALYIKKKESEILCVE